MADPERKFIGVYVSPAEYKRIERIAKGNMSRFFRLKLGLKPGNKPGRPRKEAP
jgi:hypothetical protein